MDENAQAKFEERLKELLAVAKKKKNVLEPMLLDYCYLSNSPLLTQLSSSVSECHPI